MGGWGASGAIAVDFGLCQTVARPPLRQCTGRCQRWDRSLSCRCL